MGRACQKVFHTALDHFGVTVLGGVAWVALGVARLIVPRISSPVSFRDLKGLRVTLAFGLTGKKNRKSELLGLQQQLQFATMISSNSTFVLITVIKLSQINIYRMAYFSRHLYILLSSVLRFL